MKLNELKVAKSAVITKVSGQGALRQHFLDMGMVPGAEITLIKTAPMGDPLEYQIHGYELTLRLAEAEKIEIEPIAKRSRSHTGINREQNIDHPGLGEDGKYHSKKDEKPLDDDVVLTYALVGNQNCGKTTLFNQLTGAKQHVGNFPGVTVDRKDGVIKGYPKTLVTDLPGIYSMSPFSSEEIVSRNFVLNEKPKAIINIVDATNIERNLYLTMQLLEMDTPMVVALNMMDEVISNQGSVDVNAMESMLGVPVIPISASKNEGVDELVRHAIHVAKYQEKPLQQDFCSKTDHDGAVHRCIHAVIHLIEDHAESAQIPVRFAATKAIEGDKLIIDRLKLQSSELNMLESIVDQMEKERGLDRSAAIADMRFSYIEQLCEKTVIKPKESKQRIRSEKIDRVLTGKYTAIPCFIAIMVAVFYLTFNVIGAGLQTLLELGIDKLSALADCALTAANVNPVIHSLIIDGVFTGVGSVLSFLPIIVTLFFFLSLMEDTGYIARVAFVMDKLLRKIGLSGRSIVPMLIGFGCTVPAVMATRTLTSERDRKMTILLTPFMSCSAKLPIYSFFVSVNYRLPSAKNVAQLLWEKAKDFLQRAFSVILIATVVVWFLQKFDLKFNMTEDSSQSILAAVSGLIAPIFKPLGIGDWRICTALICGFMAKESVVSTLEVLFGGSIAAVLTPLAAFSLLVFSLLYTPCVAAVASVKRELGAKWAAAVVAWQCLVAWVAAFIIYSVGTLIGV